MNNIIIIGSGPAGLTAALYTARAQLSPVVIEGTEPGGQLMTTTIIENWPGHPDGIDGPELMNNMKQQVLRFGTEIKSGTVSAADLAGHELSVTVGTETLQAKTVIIATGASARLLGLPAESQLMGRGVSVCATCDGFFFRNREVLVVGGGDSAMEEALFLSTLCSKVTVVHRRDELRASRIMQQRAFDTGNIHFLWNSAVADIHDVEKGTVTGASIKNVNTGEITPLPCEGVFMALGHIPNTSLFKNQIDMDSHGYILTSQNTATSVPGVFAAGDVTDPVYKQAVTAAGMGCMAALDAERFLRDS